MKTQGVSNAMQMAHYKLTIIIYYYYYYTLLNHFLDYFQYLNKYCPLNFWTRLKVSSFKIYWLIYFFIYLEHYKEHIFQNSEWTLS